MGLSKLLLNIFVEKCVMQNLTDHVSIDDALQTLNIDVLKMSNVNLFVREAMI